MEILLMMRTTIIIVWMWQTFAFKLYFSPAGQLSTKVAQSTLRNNPLIPSNLRHYKYFSDLKYIDNPGQEYRTVRAWIKALTELLQKLLWLFGLSPPRSQGARELIDLPYYLFINSKSGGRYGQKLLSKLRRTVKGAFYCDLTREDPSQKLSYIFSHTPNGTVNILCCGGDGTIKWVMDEVRGLNESLGGSLSGGVTFSPLPLGTGNDLHNHLALLCKDADIISNIALLDDSKLAVLSLCPSPALSFDRWRILISRMHLTNATSSPARKRNKIKQLPRDVRTGLLPSFLLPPKEVTFNNYFGIGVDGDLTRSYHLLRKTRPSLFVNRFVNKLLYAMVWVYKLVRGDRKLVSRSLELVVDNQVVNLTQMNLRGIVFSNIKSYAGGSLLWGKVSEEGGRYVAQNSGDGVLEVVGLYGLPHLAQIKGGLDTGVPLAQGREIKVITKTRLAMQVDGEPWLQPPCVIEIKLAER